MIKESDVIVKSRRLYCEKCGEEMVSKGNALLTNPVQYKYKCYKCGSETTEPEKYPEIFFVDPKGIM